MAEVAKDRGIALAWCEVPRSMEPRGSCRLLGNSGLALADRVGAPVLQRQPNACFSRVQALDNPVQINI